MRITTTPTVEAVGRLRITGDIIAPIWRKYITRETKRGVYCDHLAVQILADIVGWYRPLVVKDEESGEVVSITKRFHYDKLQRSYKQFADLMICSPAQAKESIDRLVDLGLVTREFRDIEVNGYMLNNRMFLDLNVAELEHITFGKLVPPPHEFTDPSPRTQGDPSPRTQGDPSPRTQGDIPILLLPNNKYLNKEGKVESESNSGGGGTTSQTQLHFPEQPIIAKEPTPPTPPPADFRDMIPDKLRTPEFIKIWGEWVQERKKNRKPLTKKAVELQMKLLSQYPPSTAIEMIETSLMNNYQGIFPPKSNNYQNAKSNNQQRGRGMEPDDFTHTREQDWLAPRKH